MKNKNKKKQVEVLDKDFEIIPGTFDPVFKEIFTSPDCHNFVCSLIHHITGIDLNFLKRNLKVINPNLPKSRAKEKNKPTDVLLSVKGHLINIEMNKDYYDGLFEKNDMYQHTILSRSMKAGDSYNDLKRMIQINIDMFSKFKKDISVFKLMEVDTHEIENNYYIKYHISLPKILDKYYNGEEVEYVVKLLSILGINKKEDLEKISKGDSVLMEVSKKLEELSLDDIMVDLYDVEKDRQMEEKAKEEYRQKQIAEAEEKAQKQGIEKGIETGSKEKALEIAKNLLKTGMDIKEISKCTGINEEEIKKLT